MRVVTLLVIDLTIGVNMVIFVMKMKSPFFFFGTFHIYHKDLRVWTWVPLLMGCPVAAGEGRGCGRGSRPVFGLQVTAEAAGRGEALAAERTTR